ncbi:MAG: hypothetical protein JWN91_2153 [Nocardioides sp.]|nr:hypothetical protein [Nocardioides sp.]
MIDHSGRADADAMSDVELVDELISLERLTSAAAAAKARLTAELHARRRAHDAAVGVPPERCGRAVAHEVALARRESPYAGREHVGLALALVHDLPETLAALERGDINEQRALIVARETADLPREDRAHVDASLAPRMAGMGNREILVATRRLAFELDPDGAEARASRAHARRRVTCRSLGDGMARVSADLRAADAVVAMDSLHEYADLRRAMGDPRSRDQMIADEFADRLDRPAEVGRRHVAVQLVMNAEMLLGEDTTTPPHLVGYGPVSPTVAADLLASAEGEVLIRRLYASPDDHGLVAMDSKGIVFTGALRRLLFARDGDTCRTPWCDAPPRHGDHVVGRARGGSTDLDQGQGLCESCNYAKEQPGWRHRTTSRWPERHTVETTTPTGHRHLSRAPALPVPTSPDGRRRTLVVELYHPAFVIDLAA